jgi:hypothetical protein
VRFEPLRFDELRSVWKKLLGSGKITYQGKDFDIRISDFSSGVNVAFPN